MSTRRMPAIAWRSPLDSVGAIMAASRVGLSNEEIAVVMLRQYDATQSPTVQAAFRSADLGLPTRADKDWVAAQIAKRHRYYATKVFPLMQAAGLAISPELAGETLEEFEA